MEIAGLKLWQAMIVLVLAGMGYDPSLGGSGVVAVFVVAWGIVYACRVCTGWAKRGVGRFTVTKS